MLLVHRLTLRATLRRHHATCVMAYVSAYLCNFQVPSCSSFISSTPVRPHVRHAHQRMGPSSVPFTRPAYVDAFAPWEHLRFQLSPATSIISGTHQTCDLVVLVVTCSLALGLSVLYVAVSYAFVLLQSIITIFFLEALPGFLRCKVLVHATRVVVRSPVLQVLRVSFSYRVYQV